MQQTQPLTPLFDLKAMYQVQLETAPEEKRKEIEQEIAFCDLLILQHNERGCGKCL
jgi:hypothetical protein